MMNTGQFSMLYTGQLFLNLKTISLIRSMGLFISLGKKCGQQVILKSKTSMAGWDVEQSNQTSTKKFCQFEFKLNYL